MRQGFPPITAAGVKATLKSLRTRVGLQPDRITSTSLALDTLERLTMVRYLQDQGLDRAAAIVEAVRAAAAALPVTDGLIVDAALSLRMNAEAERARTCTPKTSPTGGSRSWGMGRAARRAGCGAAVAAHRRAACALSGRTSRSGCWLTCWWARNWKGRRPGAVRPSHEAQDRGGRAAVVIGAAVYDISCHLRDIPGPNASVQAYAFEERPGGKGLNQAVGLARLETKVELVSPLGSTRRARRSWNSCATRAWTRITSRPGATASPRVLSYSPSRTARTRTLAGGTSTKSA